MLASSPTRSRPRSSSNLSKKRSRRAQHGTHPAHGPDTPGSPSIQRRIRTVVQPLALRRIQQVPAPAFAELYERLYRVPTTVGRSGPARHEVEGGRQRRHPLLQRARQARKQRGARGDPYTPEAQRLSRTGSPPGYPLLKSQSDPDNFVRRCRELGLQGPRAVTVGSSRVDLQACKLEYSIVSPK